MIIKKFSLYDRGAEGFGNLIISHFESMKMLLTTRIFKRIEEEILLSIEDEGFRVTVKKVGSVLSTVHHYQSIPH